MYKKILAATDMLAVCDTAVLTAAEIAKQNDAKLYILHVLESAYSGKYRHFVKHFETGEEIVSGEEYEEAVKEELDKTCGEALKPYSNYEIKVTVPTNNFVPTDFIDFIAAASYTLKAWLFANN